MSINQIITTVVATIGGVGVLVAAVAWLVKALVSNRLERDVEKFKIEMKASADTEIERVKAFLARTARVHERQVDILTKLYRHFFAAQTYLQLMAAGTRLEGEVSVDEYRRLCSEAIVSARRTLGWSPHDSPGSCAAVRPLLRFCVSGTDASRLCTAPHGC